MASAQYRRLIFDAVSSVLNAAVDDRLLASNPCRARSVKAPRPAPTRVHPWTAEQVFGVRAGLPDRYQAMVDVGAGCGLRQGEIFGLAVDNIGDLGWLYVRQQVKKVRGTLVFAPPKRGKLRDVPLDPEVSAALREHMQRFPPVEVTLPWLTPTGPKVTHRLIFTSGIGAAIWSQGFNDQAWKPRSGIRRHHPDSREGRALRSGPRARHARPPALLRVGPPRCRGEHQGPGSLRTASTTAAPTATAPTAPADRISPWDVRHDSTDHFDCADSSDPVLSQDPAEIRDRAEPIEPTDRALPIEPTESAEPTEPMDRTEPTEPIDRTESCDHRDSTESEEL